MQMCSNYLRHDPQNKLCIQTVYAKDFTVAARTPAPPPPKRPQVPVTGVRDADACNRMADNGRHDIFSGTVVQQLDGEMRNGLFIRDARRAAFIGTSPWVG